MGTNVNLFDIGSGIMKFFIHNGRYHPSRAVVNLERNGGWCVNFI